MGLHKANLRYVYCMVDARTGKIRENDGFYKSTYFKNDRYVKRIVKEHNEQFPYEQLNVAKFKLVKVPYDSGIEPVLREIPEKLKVML